MSTICKSCPWRVGAVSSDIPGFDPVRADTDLRLTGGTSDGVRRIMACHLSTEGNDRPCAGYLASDEGYRNLAVRIGAISGSIDMETALKSTEGLNLHPDLPTMLAALLGEDEE